MAWLITYTLSCFQSRCNVTMAIDRMSSIYLLVLLTYLSISRSSCTDTSAELGKSEYHNILAKSELPDYGKCWKSTLQALTLGCKQLSNTQTHSLAYRFTRCFYSELGTDIPECYGSPEVCKDHLAEKHHQTYVTFFMHTREMCYFLENQAWQENTKETVDQLTNTSQQVVGQLLLADQWVWYLFLLYHRVHHGVCYISKIRDESLLVFNSYNKRHAQIFKFFAEFRSKLLRDRMRHSQNRNLSCQPVILLSIRFLHWRRD